MSSSCSTTLPGSLCVAAAATLLLCVVSIIVLALVIIGIGLAAIYDECAQCVATRRRLAHDMRLFDTSKDDASLETDSSAASSNTETV
jgi:septal ring-binding cell division protein DamX